MAYDNNEDGGGKLSMFNAGLLQTKRIADLQERMNHVSLNPTAYNYEFDVYNYQIWKTCIDTLLQEILPKLSTSTKKEIGEKEIGEKVRDHVWKFMESHPIFETRKKIQSGKTHVIFHEYNWKVLNTVLTLYERTVRKFLDDHNFNSPGADDDDMF